MVNAQNYNGGGHRTEITNKGRGDTAHTLLMGGTIGVGTPHNMERKSLAVGGWVEVPLLIWEVATAYQVGGGPS